MGAEFVKLTGKGGPTYVRSDQVCRVVTAVNGQSAVWFNDGHFEMVTEKADKIVEMVTDANQS